MEQNPFFLKKKYGDLHTAPDVIQAAKRTEKRTKEKVPQDPASRIQNYLDRFKEIVDRDDPDKRERGLDAMKRLLYRSAVIKPEDIPESYWDVQRRLAREQGHGDVEITDDARRQNAEVIITDQKSSLDTWVDYLASPDAPYTDWLKYWTTRSVLGMGEYDKEKKAFTKRSKGTVKPFPDLNREALAYVLDALQKKYQKQHINLDALDAEDRKRFETLLKEESFPRLYAYAIEKVTPASKELLTVTEGRWIKYPRGGDHVPLVESLQGHGTGWCTAGESTAATQLKGGDFYVYYSLDAEGKPVIPRAAIRMEQDSIAEIRGIAEEQNLDPYIGDVVQKKMREFPDGKAYEKKAKDMKRLTAIEKKTKDSQALTKDDLIFLYEINDPIEGFGYQKDPRVEELRSQRNPIADMSVVFECEQTQIARRREEINEDTRAYVGPLFPGIFKILSHLEHLYTSFPEGKIMRRTIEIGGKTEKQLEMELEKEGFNISNDARDMMRQKEFTTAKESEATDLIGLKVGDLGFGHDPNTDEIYKKAEEVGLELCPAEVGPRLRLNYTDQPRNESFSIAMKQMADPGGPPDLVFRVARGDGGAWLQINFALPTYEWDPDRQFIFRLRK